MLDGIKKARYKGYESILIGDYLILEMVDIEKIAKTKDFIKYFKSKHKTIWKTWKKNGDFIASNFIIDKLNYVKNVAPLSIYPFDDDVIADIIMGKLMIMIKFNVSEIIRKIALDGWEVIDCLWFKTKDELEKLKGTEYDDITFLRVKKGKLTLDVPPSWFGRLQYELISPKVMLEEMNQMLGSDIDYNAYLCNYVDEKNLWD